MSQVAKRPRGRPKGSRNKKSNLSHATVEQICAYHKFNAAEKLIRIAENRDTDSEGKPIDWPLILQARATEKLFDAIHNKKALPGAGHDSGDGGQFEIVFLEAAPDASLPGAGDAKDITPVVQREPVQRAGDTPESW